MDQAQADSQESTAINERTQQDNREEEFLAKDSVKW